MEQEKTLSRRRNPRLRSLLLKTRSSAVSPATESSAKAGTKRGRQAESPGARREKRSKTRPLTTADIPDIVSAVVRGMPQSAEGGHPKFLYTPEESKSSQAEEHRPA